MTRADKRRLITDLCNRIRDEVKRAVAAMPDGFNGHELRGFLAAKFDHEQTELMKRGHRRRALVRWMTEHWRVGEQS